MTKCLQLCPAHCVDMGEQPSHTWSFHHKLKETIFLVYQAKFAIDAFQLSPVVILRSEISAWQHSPCLTAENTVLSRLSKVFITLRWASYVEVFQKALGYAEIPRNQPFHLLISSSSRPSYMCLLDGSSVYLRLFALGCWYRFQALLDFYIVLKEI